MIDIFIPSYKRPNNIKTAKFFKKMNYDMDNIHVCIDDESDDVDEYQKECDKLGCHLRIFSQEESRRRYDYVHRANPLRRSTGQAYNMIADIAMGLGLTFYMVMDDDTTQFQIKPFGVYMGLATLDDVLAVFEGVKEFMQRQRIGLFGLSQTGDMFKVPDEDILRKKVMNTTFFDLRFIYRGCRGVLDIDTNQFAGAMNEGYFTGSLRTGLILNQTASASAKGGLTPVYNESKLLLKALTLPIQFPSVCHAEKQPKNGGRLHHRITYRYLMPMLIKGERSNIAWDTFEEDKIFTNEPMRHEQN